MLYLHFAAALPLVQVCHLSDMYKNMHTINGEMGLLQLLLVLLTSSLNVGLVQSEVTVTRYSPAELLNITSDFEVFETVGSISASFLCAVFAKYLSPTFFLPAIRKSMLGHREGHYLHFKYDKQRKECHLGHARIERITEAEVGSNTNQDNVIFHVNTGQVYLQSLCIEKSLHFNQLSGVSHNALATIAVDDDLGIVLSSGRVCTSQEHGIPSSPIALLGKDAIVNIIAISICSLPPRD